MRKKITFKEVLSVLHADLIGKDSHRGITLTYGWMANQVGHFALGFIPVAGLVTLVSLTPVKACWYVAVFWLIFEIYNALSPLYKKEYKGNGSFRPPWGNLLFDTFTDLCFFWFGAFTCYLFSAPDLTKWIIYGTTLFALFFSVRYWFLTKLYQQNASLPYQFRLSQWDGKISIDTIERVKWFLSNGHQTHHFIVYGGKGAGKTRLTVGIANELAIRHLRSSYTTLSKWVNLLQESDEELKKSKIVLWKWTDSQFLLIDDINPGNPIESNKYSAADVNDYLSNIHNQRNREALKNMSVAWVVGSNKSGDSFENWKNLLLSLGLKEQQIHIIDLDV
jgi:hypothetical protein